MRGTGKLCRGMACRNVHCTPGRARVQCCDGGQEASTCAVPTRGGQQMFGVQEGGGMAAAAGGCLQLFKNEGGGGGGLPYASWRSTSRCAHWFEFSGGICLHRLSQAAGGKYVWRVRVGPSFLCSRVLCLPLGVPPMPAPVSNPQPPKRHLPRKNRNPPFEGGASQGDKNPQFGSCGDCEGAPAGTEIPNLRIGEGARHEDEQRYIQNPGPFPHQTFVGRLDKE